MKKKLLLINPTPQNSKCTFNEPLSLGIIAALTPLDYEIDIIDENFEEFNFKLASLVAITSTTLSINRAIYISKQYKDKGIPIILGGFHSSLLPDEVLNLFDSISIGEAEYSWPLIIKDFEANSLKKIYEQPHNFERYIANPRRDIFRKYPYPASTIETSRGCPFHCTFCSVNHFYKNIYFERPISEIIREIKTLDKKTVFFADDNFIGHISSNRERTIEFLNILINEKIQINWYCYSSINIFLEDKIFPLLKKSGCRMLLMGFESDNIEDIREINKIHNKTIYNDNRSIETIIKKIHNHGIAVMSGFIFGFDNDNIASLKNRIATIFHSGTDWFSLNILTPLPGTKLFNSLKSENRLFYTNFPEDWVKYNFMQAVFKPKGLDSKDLENFIKEQFSLFNCHTCLKSFFKTFYKTKSLKTACYSYIWVSNHWLQLKDCIFLSNFISFLYKIKYLKR